MFALAQLFGEYFMAPLLQIQRTPVSKVGARQCNSFKRLKNFRNLVVSNGSNALRNVIEMSLKWLFLAKKMTNFA